MQKETIFIHIPKTGGTTINTVMKKTYWQTKPDFYYRHIDGENFVSNAGDIFNPLAQKRYSKFNLIMMMRTPVDRLLSEYYFMKDRKGLINLFDKKPNSLKQYIQSNQTANGTIKFLLGERMYSKRQITKTDFEDVLYAINNNPVHVGIFEEYAKSIDYFESVSGIKWPKKISKKRITFKRLPAGELDNDLRELLLHQNQYDVLLYEECLKLFYERAKNFDGNNRKFVGDKYDHVVPYCYNWPFFEFWLEDKRFIQAHLSYFKNLTDFLLKEKNIVDGRLFTKCWNDTFIQNFSDTFPNHALLNKFQELNNQNYEPLETTEAICKLIDAQLNNGDKQLINTQMSFDKSKVVIHKTSFRNKLINMFK